MAIKVMMEPSHPGVFIREELLDTQGISVTDAARHLGVRRATLSDLLNGHTSLSAIMALRLEKVFGVDMDLLLNMQARFDAWTARQRVDDLKVIPFEAAE